MIYIGIIPAKENTKNSTTIDIIIKAYRKNLNCFQFGDMLLTFTEDDISQLLSIPTEGQQIKTSGHMKKEGKSNAEFTSFISRHFKGETSVNKKNIERELFATIKGSSKEEQADTAKLLQLHLVATFLISNPNSSISWNMIPYCVCEDKMQQISWPKTIHKHLINQIEKYIDTPRKINACVTLLLVLNF